MTLPTTALRPLGFTPMRVDEILGHLRGPAVLDVGCTGGGRVETGSRLHQALRERFPGVYGIDIT